MGKPTYSEEKKNCPTNLTRTDIGLNRGLHDQMPATNDLRRGRTDIHRNPTQSFSSYLAEITIRVHLKDPRTKVLQGELLQIPGVLSPWRLNFVHWRLSFRITSTIFPLHTKMFISSDSPSRKRHVTGSYVTPDVGVLSMELTSCQPIGS
jgi:hypothetical protein